jgi:hypothetical protein
MTTRKEMSRLNEILRIIQEEKRISKVQLVLKTRISISYFDKLRPFLMELYGDFIRYDKDEKVFISLTAAQVANES